MQISDAAGLDGGVGRLHFLRFMSVVERIRERLQSLDPLRLEIADDSHRHLGHAGARPEGETHFRVEIVAAAFAGKGRVERQRLVYALLAAEMGNPIHALQLTTLAPSEDEPHAQAVECPKHPTNTGGHSPV